MTSTFAPVDIRTAKVDKRLGIDRSYTNMKAGKTSFEQGDLVRVDITPKVSKDVATSSSTSSTSSPQVSYSLPIHGTTALAIRTWSTLSMSTTSG